MKNDDRLPSLDKLQVKIDKIKKKPESVRAKKFSSADMSQAMRFSIDLLAGVIVGVAVGYLIDRFSGTLPLFLIIGLFIGVAAGIRNMMISAKNIDKKLDEQQKDDEITKILGNLDPDQKMNLDNYIKEIIRSKRICKFC